MKIQYITGDESIIGDGIITISSISCPRALDDFDVNIIDLSFNGLWRYKGMDAGCLDRENDLCSLSKMVIGSNKTVIIYVYPQNIVYKWHYSHEKNKYLNNDDLKNILDSSEYSQDYLSCFPFDNMGLKVMFEPTVTILGGKEEYCADFHFVYEIGETITKSNKSEKITTLKYDEKIIVTTLNIGGSVEKITTFLDYILEKDNKDDFPEWIKEYEFGNDLEQKEIIRSSNIQIEELKIKIADAENNLVDNNRIKTILCNNGDALVKVVFEILEELFEYDLSNFVDEKNEDFLIEKDGEVFIGEIKGVTSNVKSEFISQLEEHYQNYIDDLPDNKSEEKIYSLLIINPFRTKEPKDREPIHERQINLANKYGSLIIETVTLLKIFDLFKKGVISSQECIGVFKSKTGLLRIEDFNIN